jgi:hypothetical protein
MIADFDRTATQLESWILAEENRTRIHAPSNPVYSTSAMAMVRRRDKLKGSIDLLKCQLADMAAAEVIAGSNEQRRPVRGAMRI